MISANNDAQRVTTFGQLALTLNTDGGWFTVARRSARAAANLLEGCDLASVSEIEGAHQVVTHAVSDDIARRADALQNKFDEGPTRDAATVGRPVSAADLCADTPWPQWSKSEQQSWAFTVYGARPGLAGVDPIETSSALTSHVAVALAAARAVEQRDRAIHSRTVIGQAQGMIMQRYAISASDAFAVLVRISQRENIKLFMVAENLVCGGVEDRHQGRRRTPQLTSEPETGRTASLSGVRGERRCPALAQ